MNKKLKQKIKTLFSPRVVILFHCLARRKPLPWWGNLRRMKPFSGCFGSDRGMPIDRYYLNKFLEKNRASIKGDVLEIQVSGYTKVYGSALRRVDSIDIRPEFKPTFVCDLAHSEGVIVNDAYDCFLLINTLHHLRDIEQCLRQALRIVRPGGVILASGAVLVPLMTNIPDYWHFSKAGWEEIARRVWPGCRVVVESYGNCLVAMAAMLGLAQEELSVQELETIDPRYPLYITVLCQKPE